MCNLRAASGQTGITSYPFARPRSLQGPSLSRCEAAHPTTPDVRLHAAHPVGQLVD